MILVDTSAWIDFFRGTEPFASRVDELLADDEVAICGPIFTELRRGLRSAAERRRVLPLLEACHLLPQPPDLWQAAGDLGFAARRRGATVKTLDLLIATWALHAGVPILSTDADFARLRGADVPIDLA
jgi:predicted nucleic acid-binding protein